MTCVLIKPWCEFCYRFVLSTGLRSTPFRIASLLDLINRSDSKPFIVCVFVASVSWNFFPLELSSLCLSSLRLPLVAFLAKVKSRVHAIDFVPPFVLRSILWLKFAFLICVYVVLPHLIPGYTIAWNGMLAVLHWCYRSACVVFSPPIYSDRKRRTLTDQSWLSVCFYHSQLVSPPPLSRSRLSLAPEQDF